jgi:hypothetical protein
MAKPTDLTVDVCFTLFSTVNMCQDCIIDEALSYLEFRGYPESCMHFWGMKEAEGLLTLTFSPFVM